MAHTEKLGSLRAKIIELQKKAENLESLRSRGLAEVAALISRHGLSLADWKDAVALSKESRATKRKKSSKRGRSVPAKFADDKGNKWSGRGRLPLWLVAAQKSGKKKEDFLIKRKGGNGAALH